VTQNICIYFKHHIPIYGFIVGLCQKKKNTLKIMFTDIEPSPKMYEEFKVVLDILSYYLW
jgi:hypothetical protein